MKLPESTEWLLHCAATLAQLAPGERASAAQLAEYYGVPAAYLAKQLQALVRGGLFTATTGPRGGFRLARSADEITMLELVETADGIAPPYLCREIRQQGRGALRPEDCEQICILAATMAKAHQAFRDSLGTVTVADILATLPAGASARTRRLLARAPSLATSCPGVPARKEGFPEAGTAAWAAVALPQDHSRSRRRCR